MKITRTPTGICVCVNQDYVGEAIEHIEQGIADGLYRNGYTLCRASFLDGMFDSRQYIIVHRMAIERNSGMPVVFPDTEVFLVDGDKQWRAIQIGDWANFEQCVNWREDLLTQKWGKVA